MYLKDLQKLVADKTGVDAHTVAQVLMTTLDTINEQVYVKEEPIQLIGFGKFELVHCPERQGRNIRTGEPLTVPARERMKFTPSKSTAQTLQKG